MEHEKCHYCSSKGMFSHSCFSWWHHFLFKLYHELSRNLCNIVFKLLMNFHFVVCKEINNLQNCYCTCKKTFNFLYIRKLISESYVSDFSLVMKKEDTYISWKVFRIPLVIKFSRSISMSSRLHLDILFIGTLNILSYLLFHLCGFHKYDRRAGYLHQ